MHYPEEEQWVAAVGAQVQLPELEAVAVREQPALLLELAEQELSYQLAEEVVG